MQNRIRFLFMTACLATLLGAAGQAQDCAHEEAVLHPGFSWSKGPNYCVSSVEIGGLTIPLHEIWCPRVTIIMPTYHACESAPESETQCSWLGLKHVYRIDRDCRSVTFGGSVRLDFCVVVSKTIVGTLNEYKTVPCEVH